MPGCLSLRAVRAGILLFPSSWLIAASPLGTPQRRILRLGTVRMPACDKTCDIAIHHPLRHLDFPRSVKSSSSTLRRCPFDKWHGLARRGTSGSRRRRVCCRSDSSHFVVSMSLKHSPANPKLARNGFWRLAWRSTAPRRHRRGRRHDLVDRWHGILYPSSLATAANAATIAASALAPGSTFV